MRTNVLLIEHNVYTAYTHVHTPKWLIKSISDEKCNSNSLKCNSNILHFLQHITVIKRKLGNRLHCNVIDPRPATLSNCQSCTCKIIFDLTNAVSGAAYDKLHKVLCTSENTINYACLPLCQRHRI